MKICPECKEDRPLASYGKLGARFAICHECRKKRFGNRADHPPQPRNERLQSYVKKKYGISALQYRRLCERQKYKCAICRTQLPKIDLYTDGPKRELHVDHCHTTGKVRGLLCTLCNTGLGMFKDDTERLQSAIAYLALNADPEYNVLKGLIRSRHPKKIARLKARGLL